MKNFLFLLLFSATIFLFNSCDTYVDVPEPEPELINNKITYKTDDWRTVSVFANNFDANITSHTCNQGNGIIIFDDELTIIGANAFWGEDNLISIDLPETINSIGNCCFGGCQRLKTVYIRSTVPPRLEGNVFFSTSLRIYVPASCKTAYENASDWELYRDNLVFTNY